VNTLPISDTPGDGLLEDDAPWRLRRAFRQLRKRAEPLRVSSPPADFHQARIRAKRLRYTCEFFEPAYGKRARQLIASSTALQDLLGDHQDGIVNSQRIHEAIQTAAAEWPAETSLALGQVVQYEAQRGEQLRRHFKRTYAGVEADWQRLKRAL
jgi:CHAD domain-containing protein